MAMPGKSQVSAVNACRFQLLTEMFFTNPGYELVCDRMQRCFDLLRFISMKSFHHGLLVQAANRDIGFIHLYR